MLAKLADRMIRWRWVVLATWLAVIALGGLFGGRVFDNLGIDNGYNPDTESVVADQRLSELRPEGPQIVALVEAPPTDPAVAERLTGAAADLRAVPGVAQVLDFPSTKAPQLVATDGQASLVQVQLKPDLDEAATTTGSGGGASIEDAVVGRLRAIGADGGPKVLVGGGAIIGDEFSRQAEKDLARGELVALPVMAVLLLVLIGGVIASGLPIAVALAAITGGLLILYGVSELTAINEYSVNVVTMFGIGLAVDYSLLIVNRFREERAVGREVPEAIGRTSATAGRTVLFSGLTVALAMSGLLLFAEPWLHSFAYGGAGVVLVAMLAALTLVPAMLALFGRRLKPARTDREGHGFFYRVSRLVQRWAVLIVLVVGLGLVLVALPFGRAELRNSDVDVLPASSESRQLWEATNTRFPGGGASPILVVADVPAKDPALAAYTRRVEGLEGVARVATEPVNGTVSLVQVTPTGATEGPDARRLVGELRAIDDAGFQTQVTGQAAYLIDYRNSLADRLPWVVGLIVGATMVLVFLMTGSVIIPIKAIVMATLSLGATFGALVWIFQDGHLSGLLGFEPTGYIDITIPVLVFVFGFGLSMDYELFLLSRIKEEHDVTGDNDRAVSLGLQRTGRIVTAAALLITVVFLGFAAGELLTIKQVGTALALAVVLDATVVRTLLVPATMKLLGRWNWWAPAPLARLHDRFGLREAVAPAPAPAEETEPATLA
jgi:putative drug exporter of the RND superfamily